RGGGECCRPCPGVPPPRHTGGVGSCSPPTTPRRNGGVFYCPRLRLDVNDLPTALPNFSGSHRRHRASGCQYRDSPRPHPLYFRGRGNESTLLYFRPGNVVDGKGGDDIAVAREVDRLSAERDK